MPASTPNRRLLLGAVGLGALAAGAGLAWWRRPQLHDLPPAAEGGPASADPLAPLWALTLERPDGGALSLAGMKGKPLLVNFWATWCPPCVKELPEIDRFHQVFGPKGWQVVALAIDSPTPVREFLARTPLGFPVGLAGMEGTALVRQLGNASGGLPFSVLVGAGGQVLQRKLGQTHYDELAAWATQALRG